MLQWSGQIWIMARRQDFTICLYIAEFLIRSFELMVNINQFRVWKLRILVTLLRFPISN